LRVSNLMKVFALTSRLQARDNRANRKAIIPCAAQRRFFARPNFAENRSQRDRHDFSRALVRETRAQIAKTEVNCLPPLQLRIAQKRAPLRKVRTFACRGSGRFPDRARRECNGRETFAQRRWQQAA